MEIWDKLRFGNQNLITSQGISTGNSTADAMNSCYFMNPVKSVQLKTKTSINMTDDMPWKA